MTQKKIVKLIWAIALLPFVLFLLMIFLANLGMFGKMPTFEELENPQSALATELYSDEGNGNTSLLTTIFEKNRSHIEYKELSPHLVKALIATEDARFIKHSGIDYRGMGRVLVKTVMGGNKKAGGGSTISQQLALNLYSERSSSSVKRMLQKLQEWGTAVKLERNYTKSEIVTMYFNTVSFGYNSYGIRTASQIYFNKLPADLNLEESALMVGLVNAPTLYNPVRNEERSKGRRDLVLGQMKKYGYITPEVCDSVSKLPIKLNFNRVDHNTGSGTYVKEYIRQTMTRQKPELKNYRFRTREEYVADSIQWETNPLYGWCNKNLVNGRPYDIYKDGLKIYTTINSKMQKFAEDAVEEHLSKTLQPQFDLQKRVRKNFPFSNILKQSDVDDIIERAMKNSDRYREMNKAGHSDADIAKSFNDSVKMTVFSWKHKGREVDTIMTPRDSIFYYKSIVRAAFMAMEPSTGNVKAYVGGPDFKFFKFDNTRQGKRQVGSTIKPFLYTLALQEGMTPCDRVINIPQIIELGDGIPPWSPESSDKEEYLNRAITLKQALAISSNNVSAWLIQRYNAYALSEFCRRIGITDFLDPQPSLALGAADLSLFEMVAAYNTYPSGGIHIYPHFVSHIEDKYGNRVGPSLIASKKEVISEETAYLGTSLMQGVVNSGTGMRARTYLPTSQIAGKTGTTNSNADGWFIGFIPKLTAGVWIGNDDRGSHLLGDGARMALPIWGIFMKKVTEDKNINIYATDKFNIPSGVDVSVLNCIDIVVED